MLCFVCWKFGKKDESSTFAVSLLAPNFYGGLDPVVFSCGRLSRLKDATAMLPLFQHKLLQQIFRLSATKFLLIAKSQHGPKEDFRLEIEPNPAPALAPIPPNPRWQCVSGFGSFLGCRQPTVVLPTHLRIFHSHYSHRFSNRSPISFPGFVFTN